MSNEVDERKCNMCGETKPLCEFSPHPRGLHGVRARCKPCLSEATMRWRDQNIDKALNAHLVRKFGITLTEFEQLETAQGGVCAICKQPPTIQLGHASRRQGRAVRPRLVVDHDHDTGQIRGLLCAPCNRGIGLLQDSPAIVRAALDYLGGES